MRQVLQCRLARALPGIVILCLLSLAPSVFAVLRGLWPFDEDAISLFGPWRMWAREQLQSGVLPLWNPHLFSGMPFLSNGQTAVLYPPNIVYWLLPVRPAMLLDAAFHCVLLGVGGFLLARALGRSNLAAWLCTICLMLGNGVASHLYAGHATWHAARAYLPLIIWALICFLRRGKTEYLWAMALFFALQAFAGYPPYVLWSVCWCAVFLAVWWWASRGREKILRPVTSPGGFLLPGVLLILLSAAAVLPLRETSTLSSHGKELSFVHAANPSSTPAGWVRLALPNFFGGNYVAQWSIAKFAHEEAAYIGLLPLGLAMGAPLLWRWRQRTAGDDSYDDEENGDGAAFDARRFVNALWLILPLALILALGKYTPLYRILFDALPPLRMFRVPARWFEIWYFAACVLAAFGWDAYLKLPSWRVKQILPVFAVLALLLLGAAAAIKISPADSSFWMETAQWNKHDLDAGTAERLQYAIYLQHFALHSVVAAAGILLCGLLLLRRLHSDGARSALWSRLLLVLIAFDLLLVFWSSTRFARESHPGNPWPQGIEKFYRSGDRWNTALVGQAAANGRNLGLPLGIDVLGGYDALASKNFFDLASAIEGREFWSSGYQPTRFDPLWKIAGITHVFASPDSPVLPQLPQLGAQRLAIFGSGQSEMQLWKLSGAWPREYLTTRVLRAPREEQLSLLRELGARSTPAAVVGETAFSGFESRPAATGRIVGVQRKKHFSALEIETTAPQILVQSEALSPGWRAWVNGKPAAVEPVNFLFRGVQVPAGKSRVVFVYDNQTYRFGVFLSLLGLALLAGTLSFAAGNRRARRPSAARLNSLS